MQKRSKKNFITALTVATIGGFILLLSIKTYHYYLSYKFLSASNAATHLVNLNNLLWLADIVIIAVLMFAIFLPLIYYTRHRLTELDDANASLTKIIDEARMARHATLSILEDVQLAYKEAEEAEKELKKYADYLIDVNEELRSFAYVASHDLQEPLKKIDFFSNQLEKISSESLPEKKAEYLAKIRNSINRMQNLIDGLLNYSRIQRQPEKHKDLNLNQIIKDVISDCEVTIHEKNAKIIVDPIPSIKGHDLHMRQLFQNLISNSLKFCKKDEPCLIQILCTTPEPGKIKIIVKDNGIGFEEVYSDKIFKAFQRLHPQSAYEGSGIGLAVCRKIVEHHEGQITAISELGKGSEFHIELPTEPTVIN